MARLNEAPVSAETIDALKRRFVRQNRELARNNSIQSQKIRNLEVETSRLLGENINLRERVIQLEAELDNFRHGYAAEKVDSIKERLDAKIREISGLAAELGLMQKPVRQARRRTQSPKRSPGQREWRNAHTFAEVVGVQQDGWLPTIVEDKYYPRRTLEQTEIRRLSVDPNDDSPDLGPPPVARFDQQDPIKFDPKPQTDSEDVELHLDMDELPAAFSANLDTRRRRRDSQSKPDIKRINRFDPSQVQELSTTTSLVEDLASKPLRAGAKRKLNTRDDNDQRSVANSTKTDGFSFNRKTATDPKVEQENERELAMASIPSSYVVSSAARKEITTSTHPPRKVLGPKSVNTDPVLSPKKPTKSSASKTIEELKNDTSSNKDTVSDRRGLELPKPLMVHPFETTQPVREVVDVILDPSNLPPKTPAALDLLSPVSTEPSATRPESTDTPPPQDLNQAPPAKESNPGAGRPGRRARASVSYAEPNLISKMRRPTKDLADAVGRDARRPIKIDADPAPDTSATLKTVDPPIRTVVIKKEAISDSSWKNLPPAPDPDPGSPLTRKATAPEIDNANTRAVDPQQGGVDNDGNGNAEKESRPSGPAAAISALINADRRRKKPLPQQQQQQQSTSHEEVEKAMEKLDIYDFNESSPTDTLSSAAADKQLAAKARGGARRHSSVSSTSTTSSRERQRGRAARDSTAHNAGVSAELSSGLGHDGKVAPAATATGGLKSMKTMANLASGAGAGNGAGGLGTETVGRGERAAARRRSMMI